MEVQCECVCVFSVFGMDYNSLVKVDGEICFFGYQGVFGVGQIVVLFRDGQVVECLEEGEEGVVVFDQMLFYVEFGGQVGDSGYFEVVGVCFDVCDIIKVGGVYLYYGVVVWGNLSVGGVVKVEVDVLVCQVIVFNYFVIYLLYVVLCQVLGDYV